MIVKKQAYASLGSAPRDYSSSYFSQVIRTLQSLMNDLSSPQSIKVVAINFQDAPTSSVGLRSGDVWVDAGAGNVLKVVP
jgi:uncharacterized protein (UPF0147 family)